MARKKWSAEPVRPVTYTLSMLSIAIPNPSSIC